MFKLDLEKADETETKLPTSVGSSKKQENSRKTSTLLLLYWLCQSLWLWDQNKLWTILKEMGIPDHLTCLLRSLYADQGATVRTGHGTTDQYQIGKRVHQGCILSPAYLTYQQSTSWKNAGIDETQAGIKIAGRNINNLRYADDTTLMAES